MFKSATFFIFAILLWCVVAVSPNDSSNRSVCLLEDPKNQCGSFCLIVLKPLIDHIAKHQDQWSTSDALGLNETQVKLDRIEGHQAAHEKMLRETMHNIEEKLNNVTSQQQILCSNDNKTQNNLEMIISQDLGGKLERLESQQTLAQQKLIEKLEEPKPNFEEQKSALTEQIKNLEGIVSSLQSSMATKYITSDFQKIGYRFFHIEKSIKLNWFAASHTCRRMGGQLAVIHNEEERMAIEMKMNLTSWLDIHNLANNSEYISSATGLVAPLIKWGFNQPNVHNEDCVALENGKMHDYNCNTKLLFICQA